MRKPLAISDLRFMPAERSRRAEGLLGWVSFAWDDTLRLDAIAVRRTRTGVVTLRFPDRRDRSGVAHPIVRPLDQGARDAIEAEVIGELRARGYVQ